MTNERFAEEIIALTDTLYRVSYSILRDKYDREDAVPARQIRPRGRRAKLSGKGVEEAKDFAR